MLSVTACVGLCLVVLVRIHFFEDGAIAVRKFLQVFASCLP